MRKPNLLLLCSLFALLTACTSISPKPRTIEEYWDLPTSEVINLANKGDPFAQLVIANFYSVGGYGLEYDEEIAKEWLKKAYAGLITRAEQGHAGAAYRVGAFYFNGNAYFPEDKEKGLYYLEQAALQGHRHAQFYLGALLALEDPVKAQEWGEKGGQQMIDLAQQGNVSAQCSLAQSYGFIFHVMNPSNRVQPDSLMQTYWYKQCLEGTRQEIANIGDKPLHVHILLMLSSLYYDQTETGLKADNVKAFALLVYVNHRFYGSARASAETLKQTYLNTMSEEEIELGQKLGEECIKNFIEACY